MVEVGIHHHILEKWSVIFQAESAHSLTYQVSTLITLLHSIANTNLYMFFADMLENEIKNYQKIKKVSTSKRYFYQNIYDKNKEQI